MNNIFFTQAWDNTKNLGKYYNDFMSLVPDGGYGCLMDYDVMFLTNDFGKHVYQYVKMYPDAVLTCRTNRMHITNDFQQIDGIERDNHDINYHRGVADKRKRLLYQVSDISNPKPNKLMGGMLMVVPKKIWQEVGGFNEKGILDVDNYFHLKLIKKKVKVLVMEGIYVYHWYRSDGSKKHLLA